MSMIYNNTKDILSLMRLTFSAYAWRSLPRMDSLLSPFQVKTAMGDSCSIYSALIQEISFLSRVVGVRTRE